MKETMTSRERLKRICAHKEADRVPIDCGAMHSTALSAISFNKVVRHLGYDEPCYMHDVVQQLALTRPRMRERFHVDIVDLSEALFGNPETDWKPWVLPDGSDCRIPAYIDFRKGDKGDTYLYDSDGYRVGVQPKGTLYFSQVSHPYDQFEDIPDPVLYDEYRHHMWRTPAPPFHLNLLGNDEHLRKTIAAVKDYRAKSDDALMLVLGCSFFEEGTFIRGLENALCDYALDEAGIMRLLDSLEEKHMALLQRLLPEIGQDVDVLVFSDDLGTQNAPMISPEYVRRYLIPRYKTVWGYTHAHSSAKVFLHSCGSIQPMLRNLIDAGLDIINPVQTTAKGMEPKALKREFGKDIVFWGGGCEVQGVLTYGTPQQVRDQVRQRMADFAKDGGFVFSQIHNVLPNVPVENIIAMFDAAYEYGWY